MLASTIEAYKPFLLALVQLHHQLLRHLLAVVLRDLVVQASAGVFLHQLQSQSFSLEASH